MTRRRHSAARSVRLIGLMTLVGLVIYGYAPAEGAGEQASATLASAATAASTQPTLRKDFKPGKVASLSTLKRMSNKLEEIHEQMAEGVSQTIGDRSAIPLPKAATTGPEAVGQFLGIPGALKIDRNNFNNRANNNTCGTANTLAEPAAANEGPNVFYTGNLRHQEFSTDGGSTYTCAAAYPAGPTEAPFAFGDTDVIYDRSRGVTFHSVLYVNSSLTNGVTRIFVRRNIPLADNCFYTIDTDPTLTNVLDDYPHLGLSNDNLYVNANRIRTVGTSKFWDGAFIARRSIDQMTDCVTAGGANMNFTNAGGQRILVPGQGAKDVMYMAWVNTTSQWRVFSWADNSNTVLQTFVNVSTMTFGNPDCRGGTNNVDWADALSANIVGFNVRTDIGNDFVTAWAATAADAAHPQAHIHGAQMRIGASQSALTLTQQPVISNTTSCFGGAPASTTNDRGDIGMALAFGGRAGGGGSAVASVIIMQDQFSPGPGGFSFASIATGTHNPTRWGDYLTVRRHAPDGEFFDTTAYALSGGTALANINARYAEFGRGRDEQGYLAWRNAVPAT
jgi:hypothetical protein